MGWVCVCGGGSSAFAGGNFVVCSIQFNFGHSILSLALWERKKHKHRVLSHMGVGYRTEINTLYHLYANYNILFEPWQPLPNL